MVVVVDVCLELMTGAQSRAQGRKESGFAEGKKKYI